MKKLRKKDWKTNRILLSNWTRTGVLVATAVAFTLTFIKAGPLLAYPSWRLGTEGLPVKMIGLWFGPIFGFIGGAMTDLIIQMFYPISGLYVLQVALTGAAAGIYVLLGKKIISTITINIILAAMLMFALVYVGNIGEVTVYGITLKDQFVYIGMIALIASISLVSFIVWFIDHKKHTNITNILFVVIIMDVLIDVPVLSLANSQALGVPVLEEIVVRIFTIPPKLIFNTTVLYGAYTYLTPIIRRRK